MTAIFSRLPISLIISSLAGSEFYWMHFSTTLDENFCVLSFFIFSIKMWPSLALTSKSFRSITYCTT